MRGRGYPQRHVDDFNVVLLIIGSHPVQCVRDGIVVGKLFARAGQGVDADDAGVISYADIRVAAGGDTGTSLGALGLDLSGALITTLLRESLESLNTGIPHEEREQLIRLLQQPPYPTLIQNNRWLHGMLTDGVPVEYKDAKTGEMRGARARLIDFDNPANNDFLIVRQLSIAGPNGKIIRPDLVLYVNGLPLVVIELKDPGNTAATLDVAIDQLGRYKTMAPDLFVPNVLLVASDGLLTRMGSITSGRQRFTPWRPASGGEPTLEALIRELLSPAALLDYLRSCVAFEDDERGNIVKKVAGYHQFRAVRKARASVIGAIRTPDRKDDESAGKGGVVWHTQGSGKSLTMLMLAGTLVQAAEMANPTVVIVTDRNDLDDQLFDTFAMGQALLRQDPMQADSREHLRQLLDRASGGVVFTTIHKFTEAHGMISERANIVVIADEAHRSQYGFVDGGARWMREALPNGTFVGFTGTPLTTGDRVTRNVFGDYADVYNIRQAVADGATVPIYYEPRIVELRIDEAGARAAEAKIAEYASRDKEGQETPENIRIRVEELYGAPERLERVAKFIVEHWEERRAAMEGKAMIVTLSRDIAARLYDEIRKLRPAWHDDDDAKGAMKVIMNEGPPPREENESEESYAKRVEHLKFHGRTKGRRKALADRFKDPADDFRLAIVVDMWLTGFDVPSAHTMYLDKPLAGHNLMQAIARVNRVYGEKPGGLIVDLIGLADPLADALATYANATGETDKPIKKLQDEAIPAMRSAFEQLRAFFHGCDYRAALEAEPANLLRVYATLRFDHITEIYEVINAIELYRNDMTVSRPLNFLLLATPGSGKSQLVKSIVAKLAESAVGLKSFNMATMTSKADLAPVLDAARNYIVDGKMPLVFLDEFDSHESYYPLLLPLLWDGELDVGSGDLRIGKSVFFLAGSRASLPNRLETAREMHGRQTKNKDDDKLVDLFSRINGRVVEIPSLAGSRKKTAPDKVIIAMHLLGQRFKACKEVPRSILAFVAETEFRYEARSIATLINQISLQSEEPGEQISRLTKEDLNTLPLSETKVLKQSPLTFHLLHEDGEDGLVDAWRSAMEIGGYQRIYDESLDVEGWQWVAAEFIYPETQIPVETARANEPEAKPA